MLHPRFIPLVLKQLSRRQVRTLLTLLGVATAMFLFTVVQAMQSGVRAATTASARETTLVVYRQHRYCPFTSRLPQHYARRIAAIPGVVGVVPVQIVVSNCRTSLDVVTFRGVPAEDAEAYFRNAFRIVEGSFEQWRSRSDAALVGNTLAQRRRLKTGDRFSAAGVTVTVAGIIDSSREQDRNSAYVHLPFLQQSAGLRKLGVVTQFNVAVDDPARLETVARAIDAEFASEADPTSTSSEQAYVARAAQDVIRVVEFTRYLGWGCLVAVLALVTNAIVLSVQDRVKEHAVLQTLGYRPGTIGRLVITEGLAVGLLGGVLGAFLAAAVLAWKKMTLATEGLSISVRSDAWIVLSGLAVAAALGVVAGLVPAWQASRRSIVECFRAV
ncbi:MAG: ABC transporter permease [Phycisphaerae bacterium]|nr:ABC transporter permease [Phycisphaerae bacterium]MDW8262483.1 ABC transporter permease [Phycisphaerales bacterium]